MEIKFGKLKKLKDRDIWPNEATEFTPWLTENINILGEVIGLGANDYAVWGLH